MTLEQHIRNIIPVMRGNKPIYIEGIVNQFSEDGATRRKVINALRKIPYVREIAKETFIVKGRKC